MTGWRNKYCVQFLYLIWLVAAISCSNNHDLSRRMDMADSMMEEYPDSSNKILKELSNVEMGEKELSRWSYLYSKSEFKMGLDELDEGVLNQAIQYNKTRHDSMSYQPNLFMGFNLHLKERYDSALIYLHTSYDQASKNEDYYYAGLAARELAYVYNALLMTDLELEWAKKAKDAFIEGKKDQHRIWMDIVLARALERTGRYREGIQIINNIDDSTYNSDPYFRVSILAIKASLLHDQKKHEEVLDTYTEMIASGYKLKPFDHFLLTETYLALNNIEDARKCFDESKNLPLQPSDSLYHDKIFALLSIESGNVKEAYGTLNGLLDKIMKRGEDRMRKPATNLLLENYRLQNENLFIKSERQQYYISLVTILIILLLGAIATLIWYSHHKIKRKKNEILEIVEEKENLRNDIHLLISEQNDMNEQINNAKKIKAELDSLFSKHFEMIDSICDLCYRNSSLGDRKMLNGILDIIRKMGKIDISNKLQDIIDRYDNNWMYSFKERYPGLRDKDYLLVMYIHLGLRREAIALLMGMPNVQCVSAAKNKLKVKLHINDYIELKN